MAFSKTEQARMLHFLSYTNWRSLAASIQLGFPAASQPLFLFYSAVERIAYESEPTIRQDLCELESIEAQLSSARSRFKATQLGELKMNPQETSMLRNELVFWVRRLCDDLGIFPNPYSQMIVFGMGGGINAMVQG